MTGPGHALREPPAECAQAGDPVGHFDGALQEECERDRLIEPLDLAEPGHRVGLQGAGGDAIDGLGRQADEPPLRQAGHGAVHNVAPIVGLRQINPLRLRGRLGHRFRVALE